MTTQRPTHPDGPRTTVVIATRNRREYLMRTLRALDRLDPPAPIVVVDNASQDDTAETVMRHRPDVRLLRLPRNRGAVGRNLGVLCARTPYVAFSDDDSWWHPTALSRAEELLDEHPGVGLLAARTLVGEQGRPDPVGDLMRRSPLGTAPGLPGPSVLGFMACSAVVRRRAFFEAGGFGPTLFFVAEEKLLAYDLAAAGWELVYVDTVRAHHHPAEHRRDGSRRGDVEWRNNLLIDWMRRPLSTAAKRTAGLLGNARRDPQARRVAVATLGKLPTALRRRAVLPADVERRVGLVEQGHGH
ncbi:GT2 family glycosyltransferase [Saccharopolyspora lacisalsi]|uniref:GT2 family glycosyltransferase n=1 Tax=Halosaccharopolyspora lacisalsi TaxID=1000566 RepID=A0A839DTL9_9PSEU|nr:glycosyltransferase [Halosaccharopolyspora lacisalsi]MBA8824844.1 GT2 family glycosyltransferase [Halosaccharopolyspora lacisalsi]